MTVKLIFHEGNAYKIAELSNLIGLSRSQITARIQNGVFQLYNPQIHTLASENRTENFSTEGEGRNLKIFLDGEWLTKKEISEKFNISPYAITKYIREGILQAAIKYRKINYEEYGPWRRGNRLIEYRYDIRRDEHERPIDLPKTEYEMFLAIEKTIRSKIATTPEGAVINIELCFSDNDHNEWRQIKWTNNRLEFQNQIDKLRKHENIHGSGNLDNSLILDYSKFGIKILLINQAGGAKDHKIKQQNPLFLLYSYGGSSNNNNCLFYIIKRCLPEYKNIQTETLRKQCGIIHKGPICIDKNEMHLIETSLGCCLKIFNEIGEVVYDTIMHKPHNKFSCIIECVLQNGHYYHIAGKVSEYVEKRGGAHKSRIKIELSDEIKISQDEDDDDEGANEDDKRKKVNIFYDIETVYNIKDHNYFKCYSVTWKREDESIVNHEYGEDFTCMNKFVRYLMQHSTECIFTMIGFNSSKFDNFLLTDELSKHDLVSSVVYINNSILNISTILGIKYFDLRKYIPSSLMKACKDFKTKNIKVDGFSHQEPQDSYEYGVLGLWISENKNKFEEYCKMDVVCLEELFNIVNESVKKLTEIRMEGYTSFYQITDASTIGQLAYKYWKKTCDDKIDCCKTREQDEFQRKSMFGGRTQCFMGQKKLEGRDMVLVDVKSLYPYAGLIGKYPIGESIKVDKYIPNMLGIYRCKILKRDDYPMVNKDGYGNARRLPNIIPFRSKEAPLDWDYSDEIECNLTSVDIEMLKKYGWSVEIYEGEFWNKSSNTVFKAYIEKFMNEKNKQDALRVERNVGIREMCKLFLNCLLGKIMQRNFEDGYVMCKNSKQIDTFIAKIDFKSIECHSLSGSLIYLKGKLLNNIVRPKPAHLGSFMYSYARKHMYDNIFCKEMVYYSDTDCALIEKSVYERLRVENELFNQKKTEFGVFELEEFNNGETKFNGCIMIAPKTYCLYQINENEKTALKYRAKGVGLSDECVELSNKDELDAYMKQKNIKKNAKTLEWFDGWMPEHFEDYRKEVNLDFFDEEYLHNVKKGEVGSIEFFEKLYQNSPITVMTNVFKKGVKREGEKYNFNIKLIQSYKQFK